MDHGDHVRLIQDGIQGKVWAEMGSGTGAFTLALADVLGKKGTIYSVDSDRSSLLAQKWTLMKQFPEVHVEYVMDDFCNRLSLPPLDGVLAANSLHFVKERIHAMELFCEYLKSGGHFVVVDYNSGIGNTWVPYSFSYDTLVREVKTVGYRSVRPLARQPSAFMEEIYSAVVVK